MRKLFLGMLVIPLLMVSCKDDVKELTGDGKLLIAPNVSTQTIPRELTRATPTDDFSNYTLVLDGPTTKTILFPTNGEIGDLALGNYNITVTSHERMPAPDFDLQYYKGTASAEVKGGQPTPVAMVLTQANAAVYFVYHSSLAQAGLELVPTVTGADGTLVYSGENSEARGYFAPGTVTVRVADGQNDYPLNGQLEQSLTLKEREVWKVTLTREELPESGGFAITMEVVVEDDFTNEQVFIVGEPSPREDYIELNSVTTKVYYGSDIGTNEGPSRFDLRLTDGVNAEGGQGLLISGFTRNADYNSFGLAEGVYTIGNNGEEMTLEPGYFADGYVYPTYGYILAANGTQVSTAYLITGGTMTVEQEGDIYTITTDLSGTDYGVGPFENLRYRFTGPITGWADKYIPPGDLDFSDIVEGAYTGAGTPDWAEQPGPGTWNGTISAEPDDDPPYVVVGGWAGGANFFLDFYNGNLMVSDYVGSSQGYLTQANAFYWANNRVNYVENYIVDYDVENGVFDFSGEEDGYPILVGLLAFNSTTGTLAGVFGDAYRDATYTYTGGARSFSARYTRAQGLQAEDAYFESPTGLTRFRNLREEVYINYTDRRSRIVKK